MRLVTYAVSGSARPGVLVGDLVVDARKAAVDAGLPALATEQFDIRRLLTVGSDARERLARAAANIEGVPLDSVTLLPPIPNPEKVLCIGLNYQSHAAEARRHGLPVPNSPVVFTKLRTSLLGAGAPVILPAGNPDRVDYEGELAVVIGRGGKHIPESAALAHVGGYMVFNDVSARDLQLATPQWTLGKALDDSGPCGPALVTPDEIGDPGRLRLRTIHNGEVVQDASTEEMLFPISFLIAHISAVITLERGDIIATGTPAGVGHARDPQRYLREGDVIEVEIEGLGRLTNPVRLEQRLPQDAPLEVPA